MSADILREAAAVLRERAEAATPGPWSAADEHGDLGPTASPAWCVSRMRPGYQHMSPREGYMHDVAETTLGFPEEYDGPNAQYIATMHPGVGLALAEWLDDNTQRWEHTYKAVQQPSRGVDEPPGVAYGDPEKAARIADGNTRHALAVARVILGRDA